MSNLQHNQHLSPFSSSDRSIATAIEAYSRANRRTRGLFFSFAIVLLLVLAVYFLVLTSRTNLRLIETGSNISEDSRRLDRYNQQLAVLEGRMAGYIADSVETQLHRIEQRITAGTVGPEEIRDFEALKSQIQLLQNYTSGRDGNLTDSSHLDHPRLQQASTTSSLGVNDGLLDDLINIKYLAYLGFASCSVVALLVGGYWWRQESQLRRLVAMSSGVPLLPSPEQSDD